MSSKYRVTKGFKFHARPQTGASSCYGISYWLRGAADLSRRQALAGDFSDWLMVKVMACVPLQRVEEGHMT